MDEHADQRSNDMKKAFSSLKDGASFKRYQQRAKKLAASAASSPAKKEEDLETLNKVIESWLKPKSINQALDLFAHILFAIDDERRQRRRTTPKALQSTRSTSQEMSRHLHAKRAFARWFFPELNEDNYDLKIDTIIDAGKWLQANWTGAVDVITGDRDDKHLITPDFLLKNNEKMLCARLGTVAKRAV